MGDSDREMVEPSNVVISSASVASSSSEKYDQELIIYQSCSIIEAARLVRFNSNTLTPTPITPSPWSQDQTTSSSQDSQKNMRSSFYTKFMRRFSVSRNLRLICSIKLGGTKCLNDLLINQYSLVNHVCV